MKQRMEMEKISKDKGVNNQFNREHNIVLERWNKRVLEKYLKVHDRKKLEDKVKKTLIRISEEEQWDEW